MSTHSDAQAFRSPIRPANPWLREWGGLSVAMSVLLLWGGCLALGLAAEHHWPSPWPWLLLLAQTHLYAGVFITAHDAMHGAIHRSKRVNTAVGWLCALLFAYNWYPRLHRNHHAHHRHVGTDQDPDVHPAPLAVWYFRFLKEYLTWPQFVMMALTFNGLKWIFPVENVILFWMMPAILATFQIFYFGTYVPHRSAPDNVHRSRSLPKNHLWAFITCYFFGYHYEHHASPGTPWWLLWRLK